jgi:hypothetical protein
MLPGGRAVPGSRSGALFLRQKTRGGGTFTPALPAAGLHTETCVKSYPWNLLAKPNKLLRQMARLRCQDASWMLMM